MSTAFAGASPGSSVSLVITQAGARDDGRGARSIICGGVGLTFGAGRNNVEGSPTAPSLWLPYNAAYRFRWVVRAGARDISCKVKFGVNTAPYPSIVIKANADVGLGADVESFAAAGTGWITIAPAGFTATADGAVWVELRNNTLYRNNGCFFDHITAS